ncbi:MAG: hypothetical protein FJW38_22090 [Acidobacteria bacterium]|nr:hypothetical protein [Acidobacteriota bacterium]
MAMVNISSAPAPVSEAVVAKFKAAREVLRTKNAVALIQGAEEGDVIKYMRGGLYGFTYAPQTLDGGLFGKNPYLSFEMHKLADKSVTLIAAVMPAMKEKVESAKEICEIEFFPDAYNTATEFIALPYASLSHLKQPNRDEGNKIKGFYQPR